MDLTFWIFYLLIQVSFSLLLATGVDVKVAFAIVRISYSTVRICLVAMVVDSVIQIIQVVVVANSTVLFASSVAITGAGNSDSKI